MEGWEGVGGALWLWGWDVGGLVYVVRGLVLWSRWGRGATDWGRVSVSRV